MSTLLTELFPILTNNVPQLYEYRIETSGNTELNEVGGGLPWQLLQIRPDEETWVWSKAHGRLYANVQCSTDELHAAVKSCWESGQDRFSQLETIISEGESTGDPRAVADFVSQGTWHDVKYSVYDRLEAKSLDVSPVHIRRKCKKKPRVVDGDPVLQVSIASEVTHHRTLKEIWEDHPDLELQGLSVKDNTKDRRPLKGVIQERTGPIENHRERLLGYVSSRRMEEVIGSANGDTPVVHVAPFGSNGKTYEYVLDALDVIVHPRHYEKLDIPTNVQNKLTLSPQKRSQLLMTAVQPLKEHNIVEDAFNSEDAAPCFGTRESINYAPAVQLGDGTVVEEERISVRPVRKHGATASVAVDASPVQLAILKAGSPPSTDGFGGALRRKLDDLGVSSLQGETFSVKPTESQVRTTAQDIAGSFDAALALLPNGHDTAYYAWKQETVRQGLPNQVINHGTLGNEYALDNIALGLFAKMGGVPYLLAEPLPYADRVVGLDIGRVSKERAGGTMSIAASTHLYGSDGRLIGYRLQNTNVEGETIPPHALRHMFPAEAYGDKHILVHRDGPFRGDEIDVLKDIGRDIGSAFHLIEVRKKGAPRLYDVTDGTVEQPSKGDHVRMSDRAAYVVSSPPPFSGSTAQPLHVQVHSDTLSIEEAIHSILSFSLVHHGSVHPPRLPVSLHYSDSVAERLQNGIRPPAQKGRLPYWL